MTTPDTKMESHMVDAMLNDMGVGERGTDEDLKARAAVKEWSVRILKELSDDSTVTLGTFEQEAIAFWDGYKAGRKAH